MTDRPAPTDYRHDLRLDAADVARLYDAAGLVRPTHDLPRIARMLEASNLVVSAWQGGRLVGVARALTDHSYCCYLSDLAVDRACQRQGIGRALVAQVQARVGDEVSVILLSAPDAMGYYPKIGFAAAGNAFVAARKR